MGSSSELGDTTNHSKPRRRNGYVGVGVADGNEARRVCCALAVPDVRGVPWTHHRTSSEQASGRWDHREVAAPLRRLRRRAGPLRVDRWIAIIFGVDTCAFAVLAATQSALWTYIAAAAVSLILVAVLALLGREPETSGLPDVNQSAGIIGRGGEVVGGQDVEANVGQRAGLVRGSLIGLRRTGPPAAPSQHERSGSAPLSEVPEDKASDKS